MKEDIKVTTLSELIKAIKGKAKENEPSERSSHKSGKTVSEIMDIIMDDDRTAELTPAMMYDASRGMLSILMSERDLPKLSRNSEFAIGVLTGITALLSGIKGDFKCTNMADMQNFLQIGSLTVKKEIKPEKAAEVIAEALISALRKAANS